MTSRNPYIERVSKADYSGRASILLDMRNLHAAPLRDRQMNKHRDCDPLPVILHNLFPDFIGDSKLYFRFFIRTVYDPDCDRDVTCNRIPVLLYTTTFYTRTYTHAKTTIFFHTYLLYLLLHGYKLHNIKRKMSLSKVLQAAPRLGFPWWTQLRHTAWTA